MMSFEGLRYGHLATGNFNHSKIKQGAYHVTYRLILFVNRIRYKMLTTKANYELYLN